MSIISAPGATLPGVSHHLEAVNGTRLHYVSAGTTGSPVLLVHGWPETWWAFREVIPLLARTHRVYAVDLRGFGDSDAVADEYGQAASVADLIELVRRLDAGPVHLLVQDLSGGIGFTLAATHPEVVRSLTAVESTLAGFGLELLADVNGFGSWHLGFFGTPGVATMLATGHERALLADWAYPLFTASADAVSERDLDEFVRTYARPEGWRGSEGLYAEVFSDKGATKALAAEHPLRMPVLAVDGANAPFTANTFRQVAGDVREVHIEGVGHLVAQEAPAALAAAVAQFVDEVDSAHRG